MFYADLSQFDYTVYAFLGGVIGLLLCIGSAICMAALSKDILAHREGAKMRLTRADAGEIAITALVLLGSLSAIFYAVRIVPDNTAYSEYVTANFNAEYGTRVELVGDINVAFDPATFQVALGPTSAIVNGRAYALQMRNNGSVTDTVTVQVLNPSKSVCSQAHSSCLASTINLNEFLELDPEQQKEYAGRLVTSEDPYAELSEGLRANGIELIRSEFPKSGHAVPARIQGHTGLVSVRQIDQVLFAGIAEIGSDRLTPIPLYQEAK